MVQLSSGHRPTFHASASKDSVWIPLLPHLLLPSNVSTDCHFQDPTALWPPGHFTVMLNKTKHFLLPILSLPWALTSSLTASSPLTPFL